MTVPALEIVRALEAAEAAACRSYTTAAPTEVAAGLGLAASDLGPALAVRATAFDILMYNRVVGLGVAAPAREGELDRAIAFFRDAGVPRCMVHEAPGAEPAVLPAWLEARGFARHNHWLRLHRPVARPQGLPDPRVRPIGREHAEVFARTDAEAFGHPLSMVPWFAATVGREGWHHFGAFEDGEPAGFGALFVAGEVAWFGFACTREGFRRRGIQSALIDARLAAAAELGCARVAVETADDTPERPNPSTHNLRRAGFVDSYRRPNWVLTLGGAKPVAGADPA